MGPEGGDREGEESVAEAVGSLPTVQYDPGGEFTAQSVAEQAEAPEILVSDAGGGLDLDAGYPSIGPFENEVDLDAGSVPEVVSSG